MKHVRPLLLLTLTLAATCPPAFASAGPVGPQGVSPQASVRTAVDRDAPSSGAADTGPVRPWVMLLVSAFAAGVVVGLHRVPLRRRRPHSETAGEPAADPAPLPEPTPTLAAEPALWTAAGAAAQPARGPEPPKPFELVPPPSPLGAGATAARERHVGLYDAEYEQQLIRVQRLRETVGAFVALGGTAAGTNGGKHEPAPEDP